MSKSCCNFFINGKCELYYNPHSCDGIFNMPTGIRTVPCRYDSEYKVPITEDFQFKMLEQTIKNSRLRRIKFTLKRLWDCKKLLKRAVAFHILAFWALMIVSSLVYFAIKYQTFGKGLLFFAGLGLVMWSIIWSIMKLSD